MSALSAARGWERWPRSTFTSAGGERPFELPRAQAAGCADSPPLGDPPRQRTSCFGKTPQVRPEQPRAGAGEHAAELMAEDPLRVARDPTTGEVLDHDAERVAPLQGVVGRVASPTGRASLHVVADRARHVQAGIPSLERAQAPIEILEVGEEGLVERAHLGEDAGTVQARTARRRDDLLLDTVLIAVPLTMAALGPGAAAREHVARPIELLSPVVVPEPARRRARPRGALERAHELGQPARVELEVVVQQRDVLPAGRGDPSVERRRHPNVLSNRHHTDARPLPRAILERVIARTVVYDHD